MNQAILSKLAEPFPFEMVGTKIQVTNKENTSGMVVFYLDGRDIQNRLDEVLGPLNWKNQYSVWQEVEDKESKKIQKSQLCGIALYNEERCEWVPKFDGAECSEREPVKGGLSDSFKRAACMWGIGRYLYEMDGVWVDIEPKGKSHQIKANQQGKLKAAYDAVVKKIVSTTTFQQPSVNNARNGAASAGKPNQTANSQAASNQANAQPPAPPTQKPTPKQTPPAPQASVNEQPPRDNVIPIQDFKVQSNRPAGGGSQLLELCNGDGEITSAYLKPGEQDVAVGTYLRNVQIFEKPSVRGNYNLIGSYDVAA